jgi:hypothetical protein
MRPELLGRIVRKASAECRRVKFDLYNWTEPFLHPRLPEMIRVVRSRGHRCGLSTNLNLVDRIEEILGADPTSLRVSLSGFHAEQYGVTHRGGDIEVVKRNMEIVARARDRTGAATRLEVAFHRYLGNHKDERAMREYAGALGFEFAPSWAYMLPLEKVLASVEPDGTPVPITEEDRQLIDRLALPLDDALAASRRHRETPCKLRDEQMTLTCEGDVMLCCAVYDPASHTLGSYLEVPLAELQQRKYAHARCGSCMSHGVHVLYTAGTNELDAIALANVAAHHPDAALESTLLRSRSRRRGLRAWPRKIRRSYRALFRNPIRP